MQLWAQGDFLAVQIGSFLALSFLSLLSFVLDHRDDPPTVKDAGACWESGMCLQGVGSQEASSSLPC